MTDVEKYGAFALAFVMGVLALIVFSGPDSDPEVVTSGGKSVIIRSAADVALADGEARQGLLSHAQSLSMTTVDSAHAKTRPATPKQEKAARYRVRSPADGAGPFEFAEPALRYPGERSSLGSGADGGQIVHVVRKGETLMDVSKIYYGTTSRWAEILRLNPKLVPEKMRPGDEVFVASVVPSKKYTAPVAVENRAGTDGTGSAPPANRGTGVVHAEIQGSGVARTYVVEEGDTLGEIAQRMLGSAKRVDDLYEANKGTLRSPHDLKIGMELTIP
jgi:nucleoid-associated protein YgaU